VVERCEILQGSIGVLVCRALRFNDETIQLHTCARVERDKRLTGENFLKGREPRYALLRMVRRSSELPRIAPILPRPRTGLLSHNLTQEIHTSQTQRNMYCVTSDIPFPDCAPVLPCARVSPEVLRFHLPVCLSPLPRSVSLVSGERALTSVQIPLLCSSPSEGLFRRFQQH
jgi:hypothetical protein